MVLFSIAACATVPATVFLLLVRPLRGNLQCCQAWRSGRQASLCGGLLAGSEGPRLALVSSPLVGALSGMIVFASVFVLVSQGSSVGSSFRGGKKGYHHMLGSLG